MKSGSASNSFLRNPSRKTSTNNINNRVGDVCCFAFSFSFSEEEFSTGVNRQKDQHWTHGQGKWYWTRVTCFYLQRHVCMHYMCTFSEDLLFVKATLQKKTIALHETTRQSQFCSTKGSAGISGNKTVWQRECHHQTPITGPHWNGNSTFECFSPQ